MSKKKNNEAQLESKLARFRAPKTKQFTSWSFSRYNDHRICPRKAKLKHLDKIEEPPNDAMERGSLIDEAAEKYVKSEIAKAPQELAKFKKVFEAMRAAFKKTPEQMVVQETWTFTKDWETTAWNDWARGWVRLKVDCAIYEDKAHKRMTIRDWKTGKFKTDKLEEYTQQLELYALGAFMVEPKLEHVDAMLVFLDAGVTYPRPDSSEAERFSFDRKDVPRLKKLWDERVRRMLLDQAFPARPNNGCQWCHYRKANAAAMPDGKARCEY
jgi:CRISPR/Cas system-associated exonuclease Cas4 (RecB family)